MGLAKDSLNLVELRHAARRRLRPGCAARREQLLYTASAQIAAAERAIAQSENLLSLLQGSVPAAQPRGRKLEEIPVPAQLPPGLPSALLERRPDIREAEQNLVAANAQIGAARALYFPQISLTAFVGGQSRHLLDLANAAGARLQRRAGRAAIHLPRGQIRNQVRFTEAQERELLVAYQRSIYTALREVSDGLVSFDRLREQRARKSSWCTRWKRPCGSPNCAIAAGWTATAGAGRAAKPLHRTAGAGAVAPAGACVRGAVVSRPGRRLELSEFGYFRYAESWAHTRRFSSISAEY